MKRDDTVNKMGLTSAEAAKQLLRYGSNSLKNSRKMKPVTMLFSQFKDVLVIILLAATVLSVVMGEIGEALTILAIVFLNALLGFVQEFRTERTLEALRRMAAPTARVLRDGIETVLPAQEVVPDDILVLRAGDRIAADAMLLECSELSCDESILTGESHSVSKESKKLVYMGTNVTAGRARARVVTTGMNTEMGKIAGMIGEIQEEPTPLQRRLAQLGKAIAIGCVAVCAVVAVTGILRGEEPFSMLLTGISLAVAAVPEGLPAIVTISLALAVSRMLKRNALIRKLGAVETLGCAGVICSDKTGTITENKMTVTAVITPDGVYEVSGAGYEKGGTFHAVKGAAPEQDAALQTLCEISVLCSNAHLYDDDKQQLRRIAAQGSYTVTGEATEIALLIAAAKAGASEQLLQRRITRLAELPFSSERKRMSVLVLSQDGGKRLLTKGACDVILGQCTFILKRGEVVSMTEEDRRWAKRQVEQMAKNALRVLGFAYKHFSSSHATKEDEASLIFVGMAGMIDPPRREVYDAIRQCRRAGIRPVMITGDHLLTASAIASEIKLLTPGDEVHTGEELDTMDEQELTRAVAVTAVYARVTPAHKLRIVRALKLTGQVVAMTGDGVNDAPAVKEADIGVSMGKSGTDVTREASSLILLDDNFATLIAAVEEGRVIYQNIRKFIRYLLSCNIGEVATMFVGMLMGLPVVLLPIQILLINLVTDGLPAIALGLEPPEKDEMTRKPRGREESIFSNSLAATIVFRGCIIGLATLGSFVSAYKHTQDLGTARTVALLTLVFSQLIHVFECKSEKKGLFQINIFTNAKLVFAVLISLAVSLLAVYWQPLAIVFRTQSLSPHELMVVIAYSFLGPLIVSVLGWFKPRKKNAETNDDKTESLTIRNLNDG